MCPQQMRKVRIIVHQTQVRPVTAQCSSSYSHVIICTTMQFTISTDYQHTDPKSVSAIRKRFGVDSDTTAEGRQSRANENISLSFLPPQKITKVCVLSRVVQFIMINQSSNLRLQLQLRSRVRNVADQLHGMFTSRICLLVCCHKCQFIHSADESSD